MSVPHVSLHHFFFSIEIIGFSLSLRKPVC